MKKENGPLPEEVKKYLVKYGVPGWNRFVPENGNFKTVIVVPVLQEYDNIKRLLSSLAANDKKYFVSTIVLFVVNNLASSQEEVKSENGKTVLLLKNLMMGNAGGDEFINSVRGSGLITGFIDASSLGYELPENDGGVGLARKIGMDIALELFDYASPGKKIIVCLDADCTVLPNYISEITDTFNREKYSAAYVGFEHPLPEEEEHRKAIISYEIFLRFYVLGLRYAGSPFAIHTIGSTMICDYESYVKIGGMNKKKAAEDFYFMEKLAKICEVNEIKSTKVFPSSRGSWRVPFGTGQRVNRYFAGTHNEFELYDPRGFKVLKDWLHIFNDEKILTSSEYLNEAEKIHSDLHGFLLNNDFAESWNKIIQNSKSAVQIRKQKSFWFDGFRTLKLIHYLRDNDFPPVNMFDALDDFFREFGISVERDIKPGVPPSGIQLKYLNELRKMA